MSDFIQDMKDSIELFNKWSNEHAILDICHKTALCAGLAAAARIDQGEKHRSPTRNTP